MKAAVWRFFFLLAAVLAPVKVMGQGVLEFGFSGQLGRIINHPRGAFPVSAGMPVTGSFTVDTAAVDNDGFPDRGTYSSLLHSFTIQFAGQTFILPPGVNTWSTLNEGRGGSYPDGLELRGSEYPYALTFRGPSEALASDALPRTAQEFARFQVINFIREGRSPPQYFVEVHAVTPIPEPSTTLILLGGLTGMIALRAEKWLRFLG